jgi:hypothetical protein
MNDYEIVPVLCANSDLVKQLLHQQAVIIITAIL